jgi:hypothetical protein
LKADQPASALLSALQSVLTQVADPSKVLKIILGQAVGQTGADRGLFAEVSVTGEVTYRVLYRFQREDLNGEAGHFSRGVFARVLETGETCRLGNALDDPRFMNQKSIQDLRLVSVLCTPIKVDGKIRALVHLESNKPDHFQEEHKHLLHALLDVASKALATLHAGQGVLRERDALRDAESRAREEIKQSREILARDWSFGRFVGRSPAVRDLESMLRKAAATDFPVLLLGETGTGKSILARVIHNASPRAEKALVTVFCPALEKGMVENELFGHKKGAFTGADSDQAGKVKTAEKGTLFLDEIGELPLEIQPKLLRLLQEKTYERIGDPREQTADVRVVAATNRDLEVEVQRGKFRRDLYERLNFVPVAVPPLRERREDIPGPLGRGVGRGRRVAQDHRLRLARQRAPHRAARRAPGDGVAERPRRCRQHRAAARSEDRRRRGRGGGDPGPAPRCRSPRAARPGRAQVDRGSHAEVPAALPGRAGRQAEDQRVRALQEAPPVRHQLLEARPKSPGRRAHGSCAAQSRTSASSVEPREEDGDA